MSSGYKVLMASSLPTFCSFISSSFHVCFTWHTYTPPYETHVHSQANIHTDLDTWPSGSWLMALGEHHIDKYLEYLAIEIVKLNWAELRQMRRSKLNKQSSLLGDSTMVIRVSCELPYIIYVSAVGCLQLNKPTVHWLGTLQEAMSQREGELKMALYSPDEVHFHPNEGGSPKRVVFRPCMFEMCWLCSRRLLGTDLLCVPGWFLQNLSFVHISHL